MLLESFHAALEQAKALTLSVQPFAYSKPLDTFYPKLWMTLVDCLMEKIKTLILKNVDDLLLVGI